MYDFYVKGRNDVGKEWAYFVPKKVLPWYEVWDMDTVFSSLEADDVLSPFETSACRIVWGWVSTFYRLQINRRSYTGLDQFLRNESNSVNLVGGDSDEDTRLDTH